MLLNVDGHGVEDIRIRVPVRPPRSLGPCNIPRILRSVDKGAGSPGLVVPDFAEHGGGAVVMEVLDNFLI